MGSHRPKSKAAAFLASYTPPRKRCKLCDNAAASAALDEIIAARRAGTTTVSVNATATWISAEFKLPVSGTFVQYCCEQHRGGQWISHLQAAERRK